jgi:hypothetical protein
MLRQMASAFATSCVPLLTTSAPKPYGPLPESLRFLPLRRDMLRQARRLIQAQPWSRRASHVAQSYLAAPDDPLVLRRFERQVRRDFGAGQITILDGWLISKTEVALLASIQLL